MTSMTRRGAHGRWRSMTLALLVAGTFAATAIPNAAVGSATPPMEGRDRQAVSAHPSDVPYRGPISACASTEEFECIESVQYRETGGAWQRAEAVRARNSQWRITYRGETVRIRLATELMTPAFDDGNPDIGPRLMVDVQREADRDNPKFDPGDQECDPRRMTTCIVRGPALPDELEIRVVVRLSWMTPVGASGYGADANTRMEEVPGGTRWVLEGREGLTPYSREPRGDDQPAEYMEPMLIFWVVHTDPAWEDTALNSRCSDAGFPRNHANATWAGTPMWDAETSSIDFNIGADHRDVSGRLYRGFFSARLPIDWIECSWGIERFRASEFEVTVTTEEGEEVAATRLLRVRRGHLEITVTGFHYSSPTISVRRR